MTHSVGQVADILGTSGSTVRRWCNEFSEFLSPNTRPGRGKYRAFTDDDLRTLGYVSNRTAAGVPIAEIARELPTAPRPPLADLGRGVQMVTDDNVLVGLASIMAAGQDTQRQIAASLDRLTDIADLRAEVEDLRRRVADLERASHGHRDRFPYRATDNTSE